MTFPRDIYDLYYQRSDLKLVGFEDGTGTDWTKQLQVMDVRKSRQHLNHLSKKVRSILEKRDALIFCQHFLTCALAAWPNGLTSPTSLPSTTALPVARPDTDDEATELRRRLSSAERDQFLEHVMVQSLKQLGDAVRLRCRKEWDISWFEGPPLLYRVHRPGSHTFYDQDVGFCCPRWLRERNFDVPSVRDFCHHADGDRVSSKTLRAFETPYISMTASPFRVLRLMQHEETSSADVFVIDAERLWATNVHFEQTTAMADRYGVAWTRGYDRAHYITPTHWVAQYWIPADCIVRKVPFHQFQELCHSKEIFRGTG